VHTHTVTLHMLEQLLRIVTVHSTHADVRRREPRLRARGKGLEPCLCVPAITTSCTQGDN
jgi:hypothetical protein